MRWLVPAQPGDRYGDVVVDTNKSHEFYKQWLSMTKPAEGPGDLRRSLWLDSPVKPPPHPYRYTD